MVLGQHRHIVVLFFNRQTLEYALNKFDSTGFPMSQISVVAKEPDDEQLDGAGTSTFVGNKVREGATIGAFIGSILGAIGGVFAELGILVVPGVGYVAAAGIAGTALAAAITGTGIGAASGGIIDLAGLKIPEERDRVDVDSERFCSYEYLVRVDGTDDELRHAESIFSSSCSSKMWVC